LRLRGGGRVDFSWDEDGVIYRVKLSGGKGLSLVDRYGKVLATC